MLSFIRRVTVLLAVALIRRVAVMLVRRLYGWVSTPKRLVPIPAGGAS